MGSVNRWILCGAFVAALLTAGALLRQADPSTSDHNSINTMDLLQAKASVSVPLVFEENRGQGDPAALFLGRFGGYAAQFRADEVRFGQPDGASTSSPARVALADANPAPTVRGDRRRSSYTNYYEGNDPKKWLTGIPHYESIVYEQVYPGIDWVWYGNEGRLEYDLRVAPGADPQQARLQFGEEDGLRLNANGDLLIAAEGRESRYLRPFVYQEFDGTKQAVESEYVLLPENRVGFTLGAYDLDRELVIDPVLSYSSFFGNANFEERPSVVVDAAGSAYVVTKGGASVVIFKVKPDGSGVDYIAQFSGMSSTNAPSCQGSAIALDAMGNVYITGRTGSSNFPTTAGAYDTTYNGGGDLFVMRLTAAGAMSYSTYLGGTGADADSCLALGPDGDVYIAAETSSTDFPTTDGAYDRTFEALLDLTVSRLRLNAQGAADLIYSTYVGGACNDRDPSLVVDSSGAIYVVAETGLPATFPITPGAFDPTHNGEIDLAFFKLIPAGQGNQDLAYSSYFGGILTENRRGNGQGIAVDRAGFVYIAGDTNSATVPIPTTPGAYDTTHNQGDDIFVAKFQLNGQGSNDLVFSTFLGSIGLDRNGAVAVDDAGLIYFTGQTTSKVVPFPTVNPLQATFAGGTGDVVYGVLSPDGSQLLSSSYMGGTSFDGFPDLFVDDAGRLTIVGETNSASFPTANAPPTGSFSGTYSNGGDIFVSRIEQLGVRMVTISNATNLRPKFAPDTISSGFGIGLAGQTLVATAVPLPTILAGVRVQVTDSNGVAREAQLFFVSEFQINYLMPAGTALGWARIEVTRDGQVVSRDGVEVTTLSPGIYTANGTGSGAPAANFLLVRASGARSEGPVFDGNAPLGQRMTLPLDMGAQGDQLFITFFTTGTRGATTVTATVNGVSVPATSPFVLTQFSGLEQVNLGPIPRSLVGAGEVDVVFSFNGVPANVVKLRLQ